MTCRSRLPMLTLLGAICSVSLQSAVAQTAIQQQELMPSNISDANQFFGGSVDIYGSTMVIGAAVREALQYGNKAYVFERQDDQWVETQLLLPDDYASTEYGKYGNVVSIYGNFIAVGAVEILERYPPEEDQEVGDIKFYRGVVIVFQNSNGVWTQLDKLAIDHLTAANESLTFGQEISLHGSRLVAAGPRIRLLDDPEGPHGRAFVYEYDGTNWILTDQLRPVALDSNDYFSKSLDLYGDTFAVGVGTNDGATDVVYVFEHSNGIWQHPHIVEPDDGFYINGFGDRVSLHGDSMLVSATRDDDNGASSGSVYEFNRTPGGWIQVSKLKPEPAGSFNYFGWSVDHNGETAVISEYDGDGGTTDDVTRVFKKVGTVWTEIASLGAFPTDIDPRNGYRVAVKGNTFAVTNHYYAPGGVLGNQGRVWMHELIVPTTPATPAGQGVEITPTVEYLNGDPLEDAPEFNFTYEEIDAEGETTITIIDPSPETTTPPLGFSILGFEDMSALFDFHTTATMAPGSTVEICIDYSSMDIAGDPADLIFAHEVDGAWQNITSSNDVGQEIICGVTDSFSYFALLEVADPIQLLEELIQAVAALNAKHGIVNSLDAKLGAAKQALTDAKRNNDLSAINVLMNSFVNAVEAQRGNQILESEADDLISRALEIIAVIEGGAML